MAEIYLHEFLETIGDNFHAIRNAKKVTMEAVAAEIGVKHPVISRIENGRYEGLSISLFVKLCNFYEVTIEQIMGISTMQIFNLSQNAAVGNTTDYMHQTINERAEGYLLALKQARDEIIFLRTLLEKKFSMNVPKTP